MLSFPICQYFFELWSRLVNKIAAELKNRTFSIKGSGRRRRTSSTSCSRLAWFAAGPRRSPARRRRRTVQLELRSESPVNPHVFCFLCFLRFLTFSDFRSDFSLEHTTAEHGRAAPHLRDDRHGALRRRAATSASHPPRIAARAHAAPEDGAPAGRRRGCDGGRPAAPKKEEATRCCCEECVGKGTLVRSGV